MPPSERHRTTPSPRPSAARSGGRRGSGWRRRRSCAIRSSAARASSDGRGQPVLLIPGFLAGDGRWRSWRAGCAAPATGPAAPGWWNVDCSGAALTRLEERLERLVTAGPARRVVGQSRGGGFAKVLARRRPDLVSGIVTLGSPQVDPLAVHPLVRAQVEAVAGARLPRRAGPVQARCLEGECCAGFWERAARPLPSGVGFVSVYSKSDGVVDWRACLDPAAPSRWRSARSHCGMAVHPGSAGRVADALEEFRRGARAAAQRSSKRATVAARRPRRPGAQGTSTAAPRTCPPAAAPAPRSPRSSGKRLDLGAHRHLRRQREELLAVGPGEVRHRAQHALAPEQLVGERRDVAHVDARRRPPCRPWPRARSAAGTSSPDGGEDRARRPAPPAARRPSRPPTPRPARGRTPARPRRPARVKANTRRPWWRGHLADDVGRRAEAVEAEPLGVAGHAAARGSRSAPRTAAARPAGPGSRRGSESRSARRPPPARRSRRRACSR